MLYGAKEKKLQLSFGEIDYITFGRGKKPLVMIQGLNTRGIHGMALPLAYMYRMFAKAYTVYVFDRRPNVFEGITVQTLAEDTAAAMDALGLQNAAVIGVSQGGMIAQHLAMQRPDLVEKLVLAVTLSRNNDTVKSVVTHWITLTEQDQMKALIRDMAEKMYSPAYMRRYKAFLPLLTVVQKPKDKERFVHLAKACLTCDTYDVLAQIQCPTLVLGGGMDQIVGSEASREIAHQLGCELYLYPNLGHAAYEEAKDFNKRMFNFLKG